MIIFKKNCYLRQTLLIIKFTILELQIKFVSIINGHAKFSRKYNFCLCLIKPASDKARLIELIGDEAIGDGSNSVAKHGDLLVAEVVVDVEGLALIEIPCSLGIPAPRRKSMPKRFRRVANETEAECRALTRWAEW